MGDVAGEPFILEQWQKDKIIRPLFGQKKWNERLGKYVRRYREAFIMVPRGSGKSTLMAAIALYELVLGAQTGGRIFSAGTDAANASLIFQQARDMVAASDILSERVRNYVYSIVCGSNTYKPIAADARKKHGLNPSLVLIDDFQECSAELYNILRTACVKRQEALLVTICTAGYDKESICYQQYEYAKQIERGDIDNDEFLVVIYELPKDADWKDAVNWPIASPNLGVSIPLENFRAEYKKAIASPSYENIFRMLHLNQWMEQSTRWLTMELWGINNSNVIKADNYRGQKCYAGLDVASTTDMTALTLLFPKPDGKYDVLPYFWIPGDNLYKKQKKDGFDYQRYVKEGLIKTHPGAAIDPELLCQQIDEICQKYQVLGIGADMGFNPYVPNILFNNYELPVSRIRFSYYGISDPSKEFERLWVMGKFNFGSNPVMRWQLANVQVKADINGNILPIKGKYNKRNDGIVAAIMGLAKAMEDDSGVTNNANIKLGDNFRLTMI